MNIETAMMLAFLIVTGLSVWKFYMFFPNKPLPDDDTNEASQEELTQIMLDTIVRHHSPENPLDTPKLLELMTNHPNFDREHYWRFNHNKLNQLLQRYYIRHPATGSIPDIYRQHSTQALSDDDRKKETTGTSGGA